MRRTNLTIIGRYGYKRNHMASGSFPDHHFSGRYAWSKMGRKPGGGIYLVSDYSNCLDFLRS